MAGFEHLWRVVQVTRPGHQPNTNSRGARQDNLRSPALQSYAQERTPLQHPVGRLEHITVQLVEPTASRDEDQTSLRAASLLQLR